MSPQRPCTENRAWFDGVGSASVPSRRAFHHHMASVTLHKLRLACLTDQTTHMSQQASSAKFILNQYAPA